MNLRLGLLGLVCLMWSAGALAAEERELSLGELKDGLAARSQRYSTAHLKFGEACFYASKPDEVLVIREYDLCKSGEKIPVTFLDREGPRRATTQTTTRGSTRPQADGPKEYITHGLWNGKHTIGYTFFPGAPPVSRYSGVIGVGRYRTVAGKWRAFTHDELVEGRVALSEAVQNEEWELIGKKTVGAYAAWGLRTKAPFGKLKESVEVWLAPDRDFAPVEVTETISFPRGKPIRTRLADVQLEQRDGRWVMSRAKVLTHNPDFREDEFVTSFQLREYNAAIPANVAFEVKFPVGTVVFDEIKRLGFVAGKHVDVKGAGGLLRSVEIDLFPDYKAMTDYSAGLSEAEFRTTAWSRIPLDKVLPPGLDEKATTRP